MDDQRPSARDELDIRNLVARLARAADEGTMEEYLSVFTDDAVMAFPGAAPRVGLEGLRVGALAGRDSGTVGPGSHTFHFLGGMDVAIDGDEATSVTSWVLFRDTDKAPTPGPCGRYHDRFRRTADGWRLAHRQAQFGT